MLQTPERRDLQLDERLQICVLDDHLVLRVSAPSPDWIAHKVEPPLILDYHSIPLGEKIKFEYAWLIFALINIFFFVPMAALKWYGPRLRETSWQKPPQFHMDL